jgi:predicted Zn-dependent protease with MMP-like domain
MRHPERLADLKQAMDLIAEAVEQLPESCRDLAGNALLNIAEAVAEDVGCAEAGRIFSRLGDLLAQGQQPPMSGALSLSGFDA